MGIGGSVASRRICKMSTSRIGIQITRPDSTPHARGGRVKRVKKFRECHQISWFWGSGVFAQVQCLHSVSGENSSNIDCPLGDQSLVADSLRSEAFGWPIFW